MSYKKFPNFYKDYTEDQFPIRNILEIEYPELYNCSVIKYFTAHSHLIIHANIVMGESETLFVLDFSGVKFLELITSWKGINIAVEKPSMSFAILKRSRYFQDITLTNIETPMLYTIESEFSKFKIIGSLSAKEINSREEYEKYRQDYPDHTKY